MVVLLGTTPALANSLVATSPIAGTTIKTSPSAVTITTEIAVMDTGNEVSVTDANGARVDDGTLSISGTDVVVGMKPLTNPGIYTVNYLLLAENDVPLAGSFTFNFAAPAVIATPEPVATTEGKTNGSGNFTTNILVGLLMLSALGVLIALSAYARKLYSKK